MLVFDAHLDLAMNAMEWNRDLTRPIDELRQRENGLADKPDRGQGTVCFAEMRKGKVGICIATLIARYVKPNNRLKGWHSPAQAWAHTQGQLAWYRAMEELGELVQITDLQGLESQHKLWEKWAATNAAAADAGTADTQPKAEPPPIGFVLTLEGADSLEPLGRLERAYEQGLRAIGPAHYGPGTYAHGTEASGGIGVRGRELLKEMDGLGIILDVTHLCDESFWEALDAFHGPVWASHSNCRALVPNNRQLADEQIKALIERDAVIGSALDAWMLVPGWIRHKSTPQGTGLKLERLIEHIDHVCQIAGNARHAGIGSDLDGGFGREQTPTDASTIADLSRLPDLLAARVIRRWMFGKSCMGILSDVCKRLGNLCRGGSAELVPLPTSLTALREADYLLLEPQNPVGLFIGQNATVPVFLFFGGAAPKTASACRAWLDAGILAGTLFANAAPQKSKKKSLGGIGCYKQATPTGSHAVRVVVTGVRRMQF